MTGLAAVLDGVTQGVGRILDKLRLSNDTTAAATIGRAWYSFKPTREQAIAHMAWQHEECSLEPLVGNSSSTMTYW